MAPRSMIGPITVTFTDSGGHTCVIGAAQDRDTLKRVATETEVIEGVEVPSWIELTTTGGADPDKFVRVEFRDGSPVVTELSWKAHPHQSAIRDKHLRQTDVIKLATDLVVSVIDRPLDAEQFERLDSALVKHEFDPQTIRSFRQSRRIAEKFVERQQLPRERRVMTPEFLQEVAEVYRENIHGAPTKAVRETFNVSPRMASKYVDAARQRRYLPKTQRGKKKA